MLGAIFGDIVGSPYEFDENNIKTTDFPLFSDASVFTDDTVMTVAVAKALMDTYGADDDVILNALTMQMRAMGRSYPGRGYGGMFQAWLLVDGTEAYNSFGNGSAMRVSPCGLLASSLSEALALAKISAEVTHDHPEGIKGAQATAAAIYLAKTGHSQAQIRDYIHRNFYPMDRTLADIFPTYRFEPTCQKSAPESIIAFLESHSYEDAIRKTISLGGDTDTMGAITGSIAWAFYLARNDGQPTRDMADLMALSHRYLPEEFRQTIRDFDRLCRTRP